MRNTTFGQLLSILGTATGRQRMLLATIPFMAVALALTEGLGISLIAPLLEDPSGGRLRNAPLIGAVMQLFDDMDGATRVQAIAVALVGVVALRGVLEFLVGVLGATLPIGFSRQVNLGVFNRLQAAQLQFVQNRRYGVIHSSVQDLPERVATMIQYWAAVVTSTILLLVYVVLLGVLSLWMTAAALSCLLAIFLVLKSVIGPHLSTAGRQQVEALAIRNSVFQEAVGASKLVRTVAAESTMRRRYEAAANAFRNAQIRRVRLEQVPRPLLMILAGSLICGLLFIMASANAENGDAGIGSLILFVAVLFRMLTPMATINSAWSQIASASPALQQLSSFEQEAIAARQPTGDLPFHGLSTGISFRNLSFSYDETEPPVLEGITFTIPRGKMVAIVGPSGAGKSTLVSLVARLYEPNRGMILVDNVDLLDLDVASWRRRISVVSQDIFLFNDTVIENIRFGRDVSDDQVRLAAELASVDEFVRDLPKGYDTQLGDRGVRLSGGQQQRIAIARAVVASPDLLILDEATSQLDSFTEHAIQRTLFGLASERTVLAIAHRLATVRHADLVVVLDGGRLIEIGTHEQLMTRNGVYAEMLRLQRLGLVDDDEIVEGAPQ
jgi:subfamily B ATP-binding cassette protein MsbA